MAPVRQVPFGMTMVPPPFLETRAMSLLIAFWFCAAEAFCLAP
ncbi:Uncharacterised protein [Segatella copri]|nr:Uncharacterised protein [Segatella copri]